MAPHRYAGAKSSRACTRGGEDLSQDDDGKDITWSTRIVTVVFATTAGESSDGQARDNLLQQLI